MHSLRPAPVPRPMFRPFGKRVFAIAAATLLVILLAGVAMAQEKPPASQTAAQADSARQQKAAEDAETQQASEVQSSGSTFGQLLAQASREAAKEDAEPHPEFTMSASVRWLAAKLGISVQTASWLAFGLNFAVLALLVYFLSRTRLPHVFRGRTASIRKAMEEAARASAEANRRLSEIEARLSRLDAEIAAMRHQAEQEAAAEEQKLRVAAMADARRIVEAAEQEIAAAARLARRELTAYAAGLAVALAEKRIRVDQDTDQALVRSFAQELADGFPGPHSNGGGKDGR